MPRLIVNRHLSLPCQAANISDTFIDTEQNDNNYHLHKIGFYFIFNPY